MGLNYSSLQKAIVALEKGISIYQKKKEQDVSEDEIEIIKSGIIQNFEVCYEISWKLMKKWLEENIGRTEVDGISRKELFRIASQNKLIEDIEKWFIFHEARNILAYDYYERKEETFIIAIEFLQYAKEFQKIIEEGYENI